MDLIFLYSAVIAIGAIAERGRLGPILIFVFLWSTIVYNPIACWTWNPVGWGRRLGVLDFAGGIAVHATSGASALAISIYLRHRYEYRLGHRWPQNNLVNIILGTVMMWYGKMLFLYLSKHEGLRQLISPVKQAGLGSTAEAPYLQILLPFRPSSIRTFQQRQVG